MSLSKIRSKFHEDIKQERSPPGKLTSYLAFVAQENPEGAELLRSDLKKVFGTIEGLRVLKAFEKALVTSALPLDASDRALLADNTLRNFSLELRSIVANG